MDESELNAQGLHDDRKREVAEWRRLVEEAQQRSATWQHNHEDALKAADDARADAKRNALSNIELRIEVDRLKGELKTMTVMWQALVDNAPKLHGEIKRLKSEAVEMGDARDVAEAQLATHFEESKRLIRELERAESRHLQTIDERDSFEDAVTEAAVALGCEEEWSSVHDHRTCVPNAIAGLKGELVEAASIIEDAIEHCGEIDDKRARAFMDAYPAATPAEQAQTTAGGEEARAERDLLKGELAEARRWIEKLTWGKDTMLTRQAEAFLAAPPAEQAQPTYDDGEGKPAPLNAERLISAKPIKTAKQAQGEAAPYFRTEEKCGHSVTATSSVGLNGAIAAHEKECPNVQVAALAKRVNVIEEWARRQIAEPWFDPERKPAPPEAAVAGHAFVANPDCTVCLSCFDDTGKRVGPNDPIHAVPPIPGGSR